MTIENLIARLDRAQALCEAALAAQERGETGWQLRVANARRAAYAALTAYEEQYPDAQAHP
jgi:hypothetical protein